MTDIRIQQISDAIKSGDVSAVEALLKSGVDVSSKGTSGEPLINEAAALGQTEIIKLLYDNGADIVNSRDSKGNSASTNAHHNKHFDTVKYIDDVVKHEMAKAHLKHEADKVADGITDAAHKVKDGVSNAAHKIGDKASELFHDTKNALNTPSAPEVKTDVPSFVQQDAPFADAHPVLVEHPSAVDMTA